MPDSQIWRYQNHPPQTAVIHWKAMVKKLAIDWTGLLPETEKGNLRILVLTNHFTR